VAALEFYFLLETKVTSVPFVSDKKNGGTTMTKWIGGGEYFVSCIFVSFVAFVMLIRWIVVLCWGITYKGWSVFIVGAFSLMMKRVDRSNWR